MLKLSCLLPGLYNYFTHAENPEKTKYDPNDIESGCGFDQKNFY